MRVLRGLAAARVIATRIRVLVQGNGQRAKVCTGLGKRVVRAAQIGLLVLGAAVLGQTLSSTASAGTVHVLVKADSTDVIPEADETNNVGDAELTVALPMSS